MKIRRTIGVIMAEDNGLYRYPRSVIHSIPGVLDPLSIRLNPCFGNHSDASRPNVLPRSNKTQLPTFQREQNQSSNQTRELNCRTSASHHTSCATRDVFIRQCFRPPAARLSAVSSRILSQHRHRASGAPNGRVSQPSWERLLESPLSDDDELEGGGHLVSKSKEMVR